MFKEQTIILYETGNITNFLFSSLRSKIFQDGEQFLTETVFYITNPWGDTKHNEISILVVCKLKCNQLFYNVLKDYVACMSFLKMQQPSSVTMAQMSLHVKR